jgi:1,4-alpha-glucan branching enzyme
MNRAWVFLLAIALGAGAATPQRLFPPQAFSLRPQKAEGGVLFQCYAPAARIVYLAGDFNGWANNVDGRITNAEFALSGPDANGVWHKTVKLDPGVYRFKFNLNGEASGWFAPDSIDELDADKNAIIHVDTHGDAVVRSAHNPGWRPQHTEHGVIFQCYAPEAHLVYLVGDFNEWGHNRDGLVFDPKFAMNGPDTDGVWRATIELKPEQHAYQFVIDGDHWIADPNAEESDDNGHSTLVVK